jgi:hypothetical protein
MKYSLLVTKTPAMALMTLKIAPNPLRRRPYRRLKTMIKTTKNFSYILIHICITWVGAPLRFAQNTVIARRDKN